MTKLLPPVLSVLDLPSAELCAARLDGEIFCIGDGYAPVDAADDAHHRALSLAAAVPPRLVAERRTAAWIYGASSAPPAVHEYCVDIAARYRVVGAARYTTREVVFGASDITSIGGLQVTSCRRTVIDLLRRQGGLDDADADAVALLAVIGTFTLGSVYTELAARRHLPGKRAVMAKLSALIDELGGGQPADTR